MRVIAGSAKGRTLDAPRGGATRPATDRIRETLFAILEPVLADARVLDLFAGAGTLGIEAISRGASHATFVERSAEAVKTLRKNIKAVELEGQADVIVADVLGFLEQRVAGPYDVVFCDPPFADVALLGATLAHPRFAGALAPEATIVARVHKKHLPRLPEGARVQRVKDIGEESLLFLRYDGGRGGG